jgi:hypothetical protein
MHILIALTILPLIPAQAGIHYMKCYSHWVPAFAGTSG